MHTLQNLRTIRTASFRVTFDAMEEDSPDLSFDEDNSVREGIESGRLWLFSLRVRVLGHGLTLGEAWLGNCIYDTPKDVLRDAYGRDFLRDAIREARRTLSELQGVRLREARK